MRIPLITLGLVALAACTKAPPTPGVIIGVVRFTGTVPPPKVLTMDAEEACQKLHDKPVEEQVVITGAGGALANAFVYVKDGLPKDLKFTPPAATPVIEQKGCQFSPRITAVMAAQTFAVKNSDPVSHNIHPEPKNNYDWNQQQAPGAPDLKRKFARHEVMIPVKCNIHAWMRAYIAVMEHPFYAVTGADGAFTLKDVPPGKYKVGVWHEALGERELDVTVAEGGRVEQSVTYP